MSVEAKREQRMKIILNGKVFETAERKAFAVREKLFCEKDVLIVNGFQTDEDKDLKEGDEIFVIPKGSMPPEDVLEKMLCARHTPGVHQRLKNARVAIAGLGGLGSNVAMALARTGVGELLLVDFDIVEPSNLNRQHYCIKHLGMKKTMALSAQIKEVNPYIHVKVRDVKVDEQNVISIFKDYDIVCEAFDKADAKAMLISNLLASNSNVKIVSGNGMAGFGSGNEILTRKRMKNLYICGDETTEAAEGCGLMMPRVQICAGHQANMIIRLILEIKDV